MLLNGFVSSDKDAFDWLSSFVCEEELSSRLSLSLLILLESGDLFSKVSHESEFSMYVPRVDVVSACDCDGSLSQ